MSVVGQERYVARVATGDADVQRAQELRHGAFIAGTGAAPRASGRDSDGFDPDSTHIIVEDRTTDTLVATFRIKTFASGIDIEGSYAAQFYDLDGLSDFEEPMAEMGRFCLASGVRDPDVVRIAWRALAAYVEANQIRMLFGCSSFPGTDRTAYEDAFAILRDGHVGPKRWLPRIKAPNVFEFARRLRRAPDRVQGLKTMPPLLRSYLTLGGWVSDHAVVDTDLNTMHVFTGLEINAIPPRRRASILGSAT